MHLTGEPLSILSWEGSLILCHFLYSNFLTNLTNMECFFEPHSCGIQTNANEIYVGKRFGAHDKICR